MRYLPDTNACITLLRARHARLIARWQATPASEVVLCAVVVYELRYGAERSPDPAREHAKLDMFLRPFASLPFDDESARRCAGTRCALERTGSSIGPHDLQIAAIAMQHDLTMVTHHTGEFSRIAVWKTGKSEPVPRSGGTFSQCCSCVALSFSPNLEISGTRTGSAPSGSR